MKTKRYPHKTSNDLFNIWHEWCASNQVERFGQYVYNRWDNTGISFPELFYCENGGEAFHIVYDHVTYT